MSGYWILKIQFIWCTFVSSSFIVTLCLETLGAWQIQIQIHIRLQYTCWQMAQQFYFYIGFYSFGKFDILFVRSKVIFILLQTSNIRVHWGRAAQDESISAFIAVAVLTIAVICIFASCLISLSECSTWAQRRSTAARPRLDQGLAKARPRLGGRRNTPEGRSKCQGARWTPRRAAQGGPSVRSKRGAELARCGASAVRN